MRRPEIQAIIEKINANQGAIEENIELATEIHAFTKKDPLLLMVTMAQNINRIMSHNIREKLNPGDPAYKPVPKELIAGHIKLLAYQIKHFVLGNREHLAPFIGQLLGNWHYCVVYGEQASADHFSEFYISLNNTQAYLSTSIDLAHRELMQILQSTYSLFVYDISHNQKPNATIEQIYQSFCSKNKEVIASFNAEQKKAIRDLEKEGEQKVKKSINEDQETTHALQAIEGNFFPGLERALPHANIAYIDHSHDNFLSHAIKGRCSEEIIRLLITSGVDAEHRISKNESILYLAIIYNRVDILPLLKSKIKNTEEINAKNIYTLLIGTLNYAAITSIQTLNAVIGIFHEDSVEFLTALLSIAISEQSLFNFEQILQYFYDFNKNIDLSAFIQTLFSQFQKNKAFITCLLESKIEIDFNIGIEDNSGETAKKYPLTIAMENDDEKIIEALLAKGADPNKLIEQSFPIPTSYQPLCVKYGANIEELNEKTDIITFLVNITKKIRLALKENKEPLIDKSLYFSYVRRLERETDLSDDTRESLDSILFLFWCELHQFDQNSKILQKTGEFLLLFSENIVFGKKEDLTKKLQEIDRKLNDIQHTNPENAALFHRYFLAILEANSDNISKIMETVESPVIKRYVKEINQFCVKKRTLYPENLARFKFTAEKIARTLTGRKKSVDLDSEKVLSFLNEPKKLPQRNATAYTPIT